MSDPAMSDTPRPIWYTTSLQGNMDVTELLDAVFGSVGQDPDEDELREEYAATLQGYADFNAIMQDRDAPQP